MNRKDPTSFLRSPCLKSVIRMKIPQLMNNPTVLNINILHRNTIVSFNDCKQQSKYNLFHSFNGDSLHTTCSTIKYIQTSHVRQ